MDVRAAAPNCYASRPLPVAPLARLRRLARVHMGPRLRGDDMWDAAGKRSAPCRLYALFFLFFSSTSSYSASTTFSSLAPDAVAPPSEPGVPPLSEGLA